MSVLIKGMEMPTCCEECRFSIDGFCQAMEPGARTDDDKAQVSNWCPLVEVPKHGRLIDADVLNLEYEVEMADDWKTAHEIANCVKYAPTIIEAEE